jgi:hypothetical protein
VPPIVGDVLRSPSQPLDPAVRSRFEPRFGHDFSRVRVHADRRAAESAEAVGALAYTVGSDLVFGPGRYAPGSHAGRRLIAHELAHVVQQAGSTGPAIQRQPRQAASENVWGLPVTRSMCGCRQRIQGDITWANTAAATYASCDRPAGTAHGTDVEACFSAAQPTATVVAGTSSSGTVTLPPPSADPCGRISDKATFVHETMHARHVDAMARAQGTAFFREWVARRTDPNRLDTLRPLFPTQVARIETQFNDAHDWAQDEIHSYGSERGFLAEALRALNRICSTAATAPATTPTLMPASISPLASPLEDEAERAADDAEQGRQVEIGGRPGEGDGLQRVPLLPGVIADPVAPMQAVGRLARLRTASCGHPAALSWGEFTANPPASRFSAETHFHHELVASNGDRAVQAVFDGGTSWVRPQFGDPGKRAVNRCAPKVAACQRFFDRLPAGNTGTYGLTAPPPGCAAAVAPNTALRATSRGECETVLGVECDRVAGLESQRLLRHEQGHYDLACGLARKGTMAIVGGTAANPALRAVITKSAQQTSLYDTRSAHGCNPGSQAAWEAAFAADLPALTIP